MSQDARFAAKRRPIRVGDHVRHFASGWTGIIASISVGEACGQGRLVTVDPVYAGGKTWKSITVTEDELEPEDASG